MPLTFDHHRLTSWFQQAKRDLPWRHNPSPYAVWVSEVMLQQTQVAVVIPYFLRWMERFPTIQSLAKANLDEVIKLWEGLGYYSRARNLHEGAKFVAKEFKGELPSTIDSLLQIKGLGLYTSGAILNFAFHQNAAAVDGNVMRVLARYFAIEEDICKLKIQKQIRGIALSILPEKEPWVFNEALIELGATLCMRKPKCCQCPIKKSCSSFAQGKAELLPNKSNKTKTKTLYRSVTVIHWQDHFLVKRGTSGAIMHDLHEFPYFETDTNGMTKEELSQRIESEWKLRVVCIKPLLKTSHSFTHYQVHLYPMLFSIEKMLSIDQYQWIPLTQLKKLAFSSGHRRIFNSLEP